MSEEGLAHKASNLRKNIVFPIPDWPVNNILFWLDLTMNSFHPVLMRIPLMLIT